MLWFDLELCRRQTNKGAHSFVVAPREKWAVESLGLGGWAPGSSRGSASDGYVHICVHLCLSFLICRRGGLG